MTFEQQKDISHVMGAGEFALEAADLVTSDDNNIYTVEADRINVRSFQVQKFFVKIVIWGTFWAHLNSIRPTLIMMEGENEIGKFLRNA